MATLFEQFLAKIPESLKRQRERDARARRRAYESAVGRTRTGKVIRPLRLKVAA